MSNATILLVDDNPDDIELALHAFRINRITNEVVIREDGQSAIDYLSGVDPLPALVLLDLNLPKVSGVNVLRAIRSNSRTQFLPVVILSMSREERDIADSYSAGANSFIAKPVDFAEFSDAVRQLGTYWLTLNLAPPQKALADAEAVTAPQRS